MKKEITKIEYNFFCDICGKSINDSRHTYGRYEPASEIVEKCYICGLDTCPDCREYITSVVAGKGYYVCSDCNSSKSDLLRSIASNRNICKSELTSVREKYLNIELDIFNSIKKDKS